MELSQSQVQRLNQQQLQSIKLLELSSLELDSYLQDLALENPLVDVEEVPSPPLPNAQEDELLQRLRWLEETDRQNSFYTRPSDESFDPLALVGTAGGLEESLLQFLCWQLDRLTLDPDIKKIVRYLAACLDDDGYLRIPAAELCQLCQISPQQLDTCLTVLQRLEPAGVGAENLSQCLSLQLRRRKECGLALTIVEDYLPLLAQRRYKTIAQRLGVTVKQVEQADATIQTLQPRPGAAFEAVDVAAYVVPDVLVEQVDGSLLVTTRRGEHPGFQINGYYRSLLRQSEDRQVRSYLTDKLHQAEGVLWAIQQRESTLLQCAQVIVRQQKGFFQQGPQALTPLRLADVAQELGIHESTVSRTIRSKYLQCTRGTFPMSYFFSRNATASVSAQQSVSSAAARVMLQSLIDQEDKSHPLSDQKLSEHLARAGCPISRRTVAKYRDELNIPGTSDPRRRGGNTH